MLSSTLSTNVAHPSNGLPRPQAEHCGCFSNPQAGIVISPPNKQAGFAEGMPTISGEEQRGGFHNMSTCLSCSVRAQKAKYDEGPIMQIMLRLYYYLTHIPIVLALARRGATGGFLQSRLEYGYRFSKSLRKRSICCML